MINVSTISKKVYNYTGESEDKAAQRITRNIKEYESMDGKQWLQKNEMYARNAVNVLLEHYKFKRFKQYRLDLHSQAFITVLQRYDAYKPGLRGINSWLYTQIQFDTRKYVHRKIEKYENLVACYPDMANFCPSTAASPEKVYELQEEYYYKYKDMKHGDRKEGIEVYLDMTL